MPQPSYPSPAMQPQDKRPNGYSESGDQVILTMSRDDYNYVLFALGMATGSSYDLPERQKALIELTNRLNQGNPNFTPYATD